MTLKRIQTIEGTISDELFKSLKQRLDDLEMKITSYQLEQRESDFTLGQIEALRWCTEEVRDLTDKLL